MVPIQREIEQVRHSNVQKLPSTPNLHYTMVEQVESKAQEAKNDYDDTTRLIKVEVARFEFERVNDFKMSLDACLEGMIDRQTEVSSRLNWSVRDGVLTTGEQIVDAWEQYQQLLLKRAGQNPTAA